METSIFYVVSSHTLSPDKTLSLFSVGTVIYRAMENNRNLTFAVRELVTAEEIQP